MPSYPLIQQHLGMLLVQNYKELHPPTTQPPAGRPTLRSLPPSPPGGQPSTSMSLWGSCLASSQCWLARAVLECRRRRFRRSSLRRCSSWRRTRSRSLTSCHLPAYRELCKVNSSIGAGLMDSYPAGKGQACVGVQLWHHLAHAAARYRDNNSSRRSKHRRSGRVQAGSRPIRGRQAWVPQAPTAMRRRQAWWPAARASPGCYPAVVSQLQTFQVGG